MAELADMARLDSLPPHHQLQPSQQLSTSVAKSTFRDTMPPRDSVREDWTGSQDVADRQDQKNSDVPTRANPAFLHPVNPCDPVKKKTNQTSHLQQTYDSCRQKRASRHKAHATPVASSLVAAGLSTKPTAPRSANKTALALLAPLANMAHSPKPRPAPVGCAACAGCRFIAVGSGVDAGTTYCFWLRDRCVPCRKHLDSIPPNTEVAVARRERGAVRTL
jgi:hypothetical protein